MKTKRLDSAHEIHVYGRLDQYWKRRGFRLFGKDLRSGGQALPERLLTREKLMDQFEIRNMFHIRGFEYGNWLTQEDRVSYLHAMAYSLFDLNKVLRFGGNIGLDYTIGIAFGARGQSAALAHFEPGTMMINLTRYKETTAANRELMFKKTGGVGSFAHEYGHALDFFFGTYIEQYGRGRSLSGGSSAAVFWRPDDIDKVKYPLHHLMARIIHKLIWLRYPQKKRKGAFTPYYSGLLDFIKDGPGGTYWIRHTELFARLFEVWVQDRAAELKITNHFLTHPKYVHQVYVDAATYKRVKPLVTQLINKMAAKARNVSKPSLSL
jgi:hypothetical protein